MFRIIKSLFYYHRLDFILKKQEKYGGTIIIYYRDYLKNSIIITTSIYIFMKKTFRNEYSTATT